MVRGDEKAGPRLPKDNQNMVTDTKEETLYKAKKSLEDGISLQGKDQSMVGKVREGTQGGLKKVLEGDGTNLLETETMGKTEMTGGLVQEIQEGVKSKALEDRIEATTIMALTLGHKGIADSVKSHHNPTPVINLLQWIQVDRQILVKGAQWGGIESMAALMTLQGTCMTIVIDLQGMMAIMSKRGIFLNDFYILSPLPDAM